MQRWYVWLLIMVASAHSAPKLKKEGDSCTLQNGKSGICRKYSKCPSAVRNFDKEDFSLERCNSSPSPICCDEIGIKSNAKCEEYSTWLWPPILTLDAKPIQGLCGISIEPTIVGGVEAKALEFPHMVHLGIKTHEDEIKFGCGATLISDEFLLTAAHCIDTAFGPASVAKLGTGDRESQKIIKIKATYKHPLYHDSQQYHDIALVRLQKKVSFSDYLRPACLQTEKDIINGTQAIASGWGTTSYKGEGSDRLLKVNLPLVSHSQCGETYSRMLKLQSGLDEESMICAGGKNLDKDTCQGDSGGPLQIVRQNPNCMYNIIGVTSFGRGCGANPGVYTKVSNYIPWIESIVWPDEE